MLSNMKQFRLRNAPFYAGIFVLSWIITLLILTAFFRLVEMVIPKQWKGTYHGLITRLYSNFPPPDLQGGVPLRLFRINLSGAKLSGANLIWASLGRLDFREADFKKADLRYANLMGANLSHADLSGTKLIGANLSNANLDEAQLIGSFVYATSAWNVNLEKTTQLNLIITRQDEPPITVDNLEVAQFIYLLLNNKEIRDVIDTITSKVVLILGRFTPKRKAILDALREELRKHNYTPVLFDFERPVNRDFTETARTLAHLSRFILADITEPSSIPQELQAIVPDLEVPVQPLLEEDRKEYSMFPDFGKYPWVAPVYFYKDQASL